MGAEGAAGALSVGSRSGGSRSGEERRLKDEEQVQEKE
jgi:hypothetical protein